MNDASRASERTRRSQRLCLIVPKVLALGFLLVSLGPAASQNTAPSRVMPSGGTINLKVSGPLSPEVRAALADLIEPDSISRLIDTVSNYGTAVRDLCAISACPGIKEILARVQADDRLGSHITGLVAPTMETIRSITLPGVTPGPPIAWPQRERFAVIAHDNAIVSAAGRLISDAAVAVPVERLRENDLPIASNGTLIIPPGGSQSAISTIEKDLRVGGSSQRQFRLNRRLSEPDVAQRLTVLQSTPGFSVDTNAPREAFSFIQFQTSGENCSGNSADWPFDIDRVVSVLKFNEKIRERLRIGPVRRSRILIVDTGLGKKLAQTDAFTPILFADPVELIAPATVQRQLAGAARCVDANRNSYVRDVYGAGSSGPGDDSKCLSPSFDYLDMVLPHPRKLTSTQIYYPDHGSFVGTLAGGGPKFLVSFPAIPNYIGLSFFRVTRQAVAANLHVENSQDDITHSLDYAARIGADIINMSLKTGHDEAFAIFATNQNSLLVASAGNSSEDLDMSAQDNRPASLNDFHDRMIVVAALQSNATTPFWPLSAHSPSRVHIAAPGARITSFGADGQEICDSGTSAAAPLVSFTAAMLRSLTGAPRQTIRARLLAAADHVPDLVTNVEDGRRLNIEAALDVFVDRVELGGIIKRGWIEPTSTAPLVLVCKSPGSGLPQLNGKIDLALLWEWWKRPDGKAFIRHQIEGIELPFTRESCDVPDRTFAFFDLATGATTNIPWRDVTKLLPTPFRAVKPIILNSNSMGAARTP